VTGLVRDYTAQASESAQSKLFADNAEAFYGLK
jgi:hypothetical protein